MVGGIKVAESAIFEVDHQAILKARHMASTKPKAWRLSNVLAKARHDQKATKLKWKLLQNQLPFM